MKQTILTLAILAVCLTCSAQFVATMEVKDPIPGLCNDKEVYVMFLMKGQEEAVCPVSKDKILERLNSEIQFLKDNPKHVDKGIMGLIINCKGVVVQCKMDNKTKSTELDKQIEAVFNSLGEWKPGKLDKREVDTSRLFGFKIKNGKVTFD